MLLNASNILVWYARLSSTREEKNHYCSLLSHDEQVRAQRFRFSEHQNRFVIGRGILRKLLGYLVGVSPQSLHFSYNTYSKPQLKDNEHLQFNLSHSKDLAVYAFTLGAPIGVDVEYRSTSVNLDDLARRYFSPREYGEINNLSPEEKRAGFFDRWVSKEACLKALGCGLSYPLDKIEVNLDRGFVSFSLQPAGKAKFQDWALYGLNYPPTLGFSAALAVKSKRKKTIDTHFWQQDIFLSDS